VERTILDVPKMYADHHVERVRDALFAVDGVEEVVASSAFKRVLVAFDAKRVTLNGIEQALTEAGYAPGEDWELLELPKSTDDDSPWFRSTQRVTRTNLLDLEMSGDFRKY
jgi:copper chaperone CopZ